MEKRTAYGRKEKNPIGSTEENGMGGEKTKKHEREKEEMNENPKRDSHTEKIYQKRKGTEIRIQKKTKGWKSGIDEYIKDGKVE